jgi:23S rRNA (guanine745-N1)-methyltransferase
LARSCLACTVRGCGLPLNPEERGYRCSRGHSYDIARSGYINLLQPQDRKSLSAGDSSAAVEARARLIADGVGRSVITDLVRCSKTVAGATDGVVADLGSGSGDALAAVASGRPWTGIGIDLAVAAARHSARRFPQLTWVVANADRRLPLVDGAVSFLISLHGRRNPSECARVLGPSGRLFLAVPAPDDLIELRRLVQGVGVERSRIDAVLEEHAAFFRPVERFTSRERHTLDQRALKDLLTGTYRGARKSAGALVESLTAMDVTLASDCVVFERR